MCLPCNSCVLCHQHSSAFIPLRASIFVSPSPAHPQEQLHALIHSVLNWWGPRFTAKSTTIASSHLCPSVCPALPNHIPISAFRRGTSGHCLALPNDRVSCSICHPDWATEFTLKLQLATSPGSWWGFPPGKELCWKLLVTENCPVELIGLFIPHPRCCLHSFGTSAAEGWLPQHSVLQRERAGE